MSGDRPDTVQVATGRAVFNKPRFPSPLKVARAGAQDPHRVKGLRAHTHFRRLEVLPQSYELWVGRNVAVVLLPTVPSSDSWTSDDALWHLERTSILHPIH